MPVDITVLGSGRQLRGATWVSKQEGLQLYSPTTADTYNWSTSNTTASPSCLSAAGGYLFVPASCLSSGSRYVFDLTAQRLSVGGYARVSEGSHAHA
jgi:hypothetical protein